MRYAGLSLLLLLVGAFDSSAMAAPQFTQKPTARQSGDQVTIEFAVNEPTDVAVFIEDEQGRIVRHLVAGVLGSNAPPPLQSDTLSQSIPWDGKADYGQPAGKGPFKARVALGVDVRYDKVVARDEQALNNIKGIAVGPDGVVYVMDNCGGAVWTGEQILAFDRHGKYLRGVMPFPAGMKYEEVQELGAFKLRGGVAPLVHAHKLKLFPGPEAPRKTGMAVTSDGKAIVRLVGDVRQGGPDHLAVLGADSTAVWPNPVGPPLFAQTWPPAADGRYRGGVLEKAALALSSDEKQAFTTGHASSPVNAYPAVFRTSLPARDDAALFFGDVKKTGRGETLLGGQPLGLASDGDGHLLISDTLNDRVLIVNESDGAYVGEFASKQPGPLSVDPKTGAIYVLSGRSIVTLTKYAGWKKPQEVDRVVFRVRGNGSYVMAIDPHAPRTLVWVGTDDGKLLRLEDQGNQLGEFATVSSSSDATGAFIDMYVDRFHPQREVYWRGSNSHWNRYNEQQDEITKLDTGALINNGGGGGAQLMPGPGDALYALRYPYHLLKFDRNLKPLGFPDGGYPAEWIGKQGKVEAVKPGPAHGMFVTANMTEMKHTLGVRQDGSIFVFHPTNFGGRPPKGLHQYSPTGKKLTTDPIIWKVSDGCIGPRFDAQGNIYVAEIVNPGDRAYPPEFEQLFGRIELEKPIPDGVQSEIANMYGSIVKFSPQGGMFHLPGPNPFKGEPKLDGLKTVDAAYFARQVQSPVQVTGAQWMAFGYSHVEINRCICETTRFDVDEFGRVWFPDLCLYQVRVVDTAGNSLLKFGGYGNAESRGPESPILDTATGQLRPTRPGEQSPLATPEIAFSWLVGVVATDKYVYTGDSIGRRMLRLKMTYATEETCSLK